MLRGNTWPARCAAEPASKKMVGGVLHHDVELEGGRLNELEQSELMTVAGGGDGH